MVVYEDTSNSQPENQHLFKLLDDLSFDDQRILSRLLNSWENRDQRQHPRERCSIITDYVVDNQTYRGIMRNISAYGAYVASKDLFPVNEVIFQNFFFPNFEIPIRSNSKIVWVGSDGFGVKFDSLQSDQ